MKRVKLMLMSLTLFAIVGGALAFKAKFNEIPLCTTSTTSYGIDHGFLTSCPVLDSWELDIAGTTVYYTTTPDDEDCTFFDGRPLPCVETSTTLDIEL